jgi:hypothetical protein
MWTGIESISHALPDFAFVTAFSISIIDIQTITRAFILTTIIEYGNFSPALSSNKQTAKIIFPFI